ncbi:putative quinol monooxygenase [Mycolicibacterium sp.]|uniref:putative quinol monooxygenase n=1 Tax=Mycolicibacterium sp. TaxID=2320850 RepID=UPI003D13700C
MPVSSVFDMRFPPDSAEEGYDLSLAIGADMIATTDCTGYDVIRDLADPGHVVIVTRWSTRSGGEDVLATYPADPKIGRVTELLGQVPTGFLGELADNA